MSKSVVRCTTNRSVSTNEPGSSRRSIRSRAVNFPRLPGRPIRPAPPPRRASVFRLRRSCTRGSSDASATAGARRDARLTVLVRRPARLRGPRLRGHHQLREVPARHPAEQPQDDRDQDHQEDDEPPPAPEDAAEDQDEVLDRGDEGDREDPEDPRGGDGLDAAGRARPAPSREESGAGPPAPRQPHPPPPGAPAGAWNPAAGLRVPSSPPLGYGPRDRVSSPVRCSNTRGRWRPHAHDGATGPSSALSGATVS